MKAFEKPSVMIVCSLILSFIGALLPITKIQYQIVTEDPSGMNNPTIVASEGFSRIFGDKYGRDALPCRFGIFIRSNSLLRLNRFHPFWNFLGKALCTAVPLLWLAYVIHRKVPPAKAVLVMVAFWGLLIAAAIIRNPNRPMCNPNEQFQVISFTPFWLTFIVLIGGALFGLWAIHLARVSESTIPGIVGAGNSQP